MSSAGTSVAEFRQRDPGGNRERLARISGAAGRHAELVWNFISFIDRVGVWDQLLKPVEYLADRFLRFVDYSELRFYQAPKKGSISISIKVVALSSTVVPAKYSTDIFTVVRI
ncbi:hypothetical protein HPB51_013562 [Rhipicephalus microplus]|uniref:Lysine-specific demethylase 3B PWWP domain-containing protein n=1 Tax=Rhipicephalus microplus TaxID=6941 RepID=A0A9J6DA97_RHIMP|nr:hypothetical protein HPB51_013562 [Rhipicephalus microplus]